MTNYEIQPYDPVSPSPKFDEQYKTELSTRIVTSATDLLNAYVEWKRNEWSDEEFGALLGITAKTVRNRYLSDARSQGLLPQHYNSRAKQNAQRARNRARSEESVERAQDRAIQLNAQNRAIPPESPSEATEAIIDVPAVSVSEAPQAGSHGLTAASDIEIINEFVERCKDKGSTYAHDLLSLLTSRIKALPHD
jgi:hypothetical protein